MQNVSTTFRNQLYEDNRRYIKSCTIILSDGTVLNITDSQIWDDGFKYDGGVSGTSTFDIGSAIIGKFTLTLNNIYDDFSEYDFTDAKITDAKIGLELPDGTVESINKGIFTVDEPSYNGSIITLECLDNMSLFDRPYSESNLTYPATLLAIVQDACTCCGVPLAADSVKFENSDFVVQERPDDGSITFREILGYVGQISCHWCKCNAYGQLALGWYDTAAYEETELYDAGTFEDPATKITDAGTFEKPASEIADAGFFEDKKAFHHIYSLSSTTMSTDDVVITGIRVTIKSDDADKENITYQAGTDGYVLAIEDNKLIQGEQGSEVAQYLGNRVIGLRFRPMTISCLSDPTIEAGDAALVSDQKGNTYFTLITSTTFQSGDYQSIECSAESPARNRVTQYSLETKTYQFIRKNIKKNKTEWQKAVEGLANTLTASSGLYISTTKQGDGSSIYYMHNKKTLEESDIVWKLTAEAFGISTDGGKTYPFGFRVTGEMITKILNTIGINADWINTGTLVIKDKDGNITFSADTTTGRVDIRANSFQLGGKTVEEMAESSAKTYVDSAMQDKSGNWYGDYTPTLSNQPASEWKAADYEKHNGDIFINPTTGDVYVFSTGTTGLEITFNSNSKTESVSFDYIEIYYDDNGTKKALPKIGGSSFGGTKVQVPSTTFWLYWRTDGTSCSFYGFKIDSIKSVIVDKSKISSTTKSLPSYSATSVSGNNYPESPNHGNYGNNINMLWKYTGTQSSATAQWTKVTKVDASEIMKQLDQETIFNLLTNNGEAKGIWLKDKQLYVSFTYAQGGTLKLGGTNNGNGEMEILNSTGDSIGSWDKDGLTAIKGKIAAFTVDEESLEYGKSINRNFLHAKSNSAVYAGKDGIIVSDGDTSTYGPHVVQLVDGKVYSGGGSYLSCGDGYTAAMSHMTLCDGNDHLLASAGGNMIQFHNYVEFESDCTPTFYGNVKMKGDLDVSGSKNRRVDTATYGERLQYCYETAAPYFGDMGHGITDENGICLVEIDDIFQETIGIQEYLVFIQPEGEGNLYVNKVEKYCNYFIVRGTANLSFSWEIKCIQRGFDHERLESPEVKEMLCTTNEEEKETRKILEQSIEDIVNETEGLLWESTDLQE